MSKYNIQLTAILRVCASCEWIWKRQPEDECECPRCGFASYGAKFVYGNRAYKYQRTQEPYIEREVARFQSLLFAKVDQYMKNDKVKNEKEYIDEQVNGEPRTPATPPEAVDKEAFESLT